VSFVVKLLISPPKANYLGHLGPLHDSRDDKEGFEGFKVSRFHGFMTPECNLLETSKRETLKPFSRISACK
jgi:hypothetical protein